MFDERQSGIEHAVEIVTDWLNGNENPLTWKPPVYAGLWVWCLSHNLATGAALCAAFQLGDKSARDIYWNGRSHWHPGCRKDAAPYLDMGNR